MKRSPLKKLGSSKTSVVKREIQSLVRQIAIKTYGTCVLSKYPEAGQCGGYRQDGGLILQAEHLISRQRNIFYGDMRNIVLLCLKHHGYWKPQNSRLYWELIQKIIGPKRWAWLKRAEADKKSYPMGIYEWTKEIIALTAELKKLG